MATKKSHSTFPIQLPKRLEAMRHDVEKAARRVWHDATELLPAGPRKRVREFAENMERTRTRLQRRVERTRADAEARGERLVETVTHRAEKALNPIVHRLDVASRSEVERLKKRVAVLERRRERPSTSAPEVAA